MHNLRSMNVRETKLPGVLIIEPEIHGDHRGFFVETWHQERYAALGIDLPFVQDNHSRSGHRILRGLHAQIGASAQGKLVRVIVGAVYDVAVDVRIGSPTYGQHIAVDLTAENKHQIWVPPGFVHGFCVTSEEGAEIEYKCTKLYDADSALTVRWDDPALGIPWPIKEPILSAKDQDAPLLAEVADRLPTFEA